MNQFRAISAVIYLCLFAHMSASISHSQKSNADSFGLLVQEILKHVPQHPGDGYVPPTENDLREWSTIHNLFVAKSVDSCRLLLARYNYSLLQVRDNVTGSMYDVVKEDFPIRRGWGTFIFNRNSLRRVYVHVNHPVDDPHVLALGTEMFRKMKAEWMLIGGAGKRASADRLSSDPARTRRSVFQRWHELLAEPTHLALSLHAYRPQRYGHPISRSDVVLSNGSTSDDQWGISQIAMSMRDSLQRAGFACALAMYDSGFAPLAGAGNPQAVYSNDKIGFGRWINIELSNSIRENSTSVTRFITATERVIDLIATRGARQAKDAFSLVSPRIVRVDSIHRMLFPPPGAETYRIISFDAAASNSDTIDVRVGSWTDLSGSHQQVARVTTIDTARQRYLRELRRANGVGVQTTLARISDRNRVGAPISLHGAQQAPYDSSLADGESGVASEPFQVHRIPLQALASSTISFEPTVPSEAAFRWEGDIDPRFAPTISMFQMQDQSKNDFESLPSFLIPLMSNSYQNVRGRFIGIQMTEILVQEIARLVSENRESGKDIGLLAEQNESGDYYLRLVPNKGGLEQTAFPE